jgi:hypothetical protein
VGVLRFKEDGGWEEIPWSEIPDPEPIDRSQALPAPRLSWKRITEIEPRLQTTEWLIKCLQDPGGRSFCANEVWYGYGDLSQAFKQTVIRYAGDYAEKPELRSHVAYDIAYQHLYDLLPDCRNCLCG